MSLLPTAPRSIGGVLDDAIRLYRHALPKCLPLVLISVVIMLVPAVLLAMRMQSTVGADPTAVLSLFKQPSVWLTYLLLFIISVAVYNAIIIHINALAHDESPTLSQSFGAGLPRVLPMFGMAIVFLLVVAVGTVLLVIPGIYLWGILQFAFIPLLIDKTGIFASFGISRRLVKGNWWRATTIITVAFIIIYILLLIIGLTGGVIAGISGAGAGVFTNMVVQQLVSAVLNIFLMPFLPSVMLAVYYDLKLRNEGDDLAERVAALQP